MSVTALSGVPRLRVTTIVVVSVALFLILRPSRPVGQSAGLVAAYSFNEGTGSTVTDLSGNNITGTIVGATWTTGGRYGNGLSFNGSTNYVDLGNPAALQLTGSMTIEAWIKAAANPADDGQIVAKSDGTAGWQFKTSPDTGPHTFGVGVSGVSGSLTQRYSTTVRSLNTWYHVAGVFDATSGTLSTYVNGVLDNGTLTGGPVPASQVNRTVNVNIGRRTGGYYFNGIIDEVRVYNRALSAAQIQSDMNTPLGAQLPPDTTPPTVSMNTPADGCHGHGHGQRHGERGGQRRRRRCAIPPGQRAILAARWSAHHSHFQWNTATTTVGPHTLAAIARDLSNNTATSSPCPSPSRILRQRRSANGRRSTIGRSWRSTRPCCPQGMCSPGLTTRRMRARSSGGQGRTRSSQRPTTLSACSARPTLYCRTAVCSSAAGSKA